MSLDLNQFAIGHAVKFLAAIPETPGLFSILRVPGGRISNTSNRRGLPPAHSPISAFQRAAQAGAVQFADIIPRAFSGHPSSQAPSVADRRPRVKISCWNVAVERSHAAAQSRMLNIQTRPAASRGAQPAKSASTPAPSPRTCNAVPRLKAVVRQIAS